MQVARRHAEGDAARAIGALRDEQERNEALRQHVSSLQREIEQLHAEVGRANGEIRAVQREATTMQSRWEQAVQDASHWSERAHEAQAQSRHALSEANVARDATNAMQRSLLTAQEYRLAEEAGYAMQTIIQLAPSKPIYTSVFQQPQVVDAYVPV